MKDVLLTDKLPGQVGACVRLKEKLQSTPKPTKRLSLKSQDSVLHLLSSLSGQDFDIELGEVLLNGQALPRVHEHIYLKANTMDGRQQSIFI